MRKFTDLRVQLNEDSESYYDAKYRVGPLGGNNEVDQADAAIFDLARPESVRKINAYLGAAGAKPVLDPNSVLRQIQRKLSIIGLQFSIPSSDLQSRSRYGFEEKETDDGGEGTKVSEYPLTYLGGRFGVLDNTGKIGYDDNISHRLGHGLKLRVEFVNQQTGMTSVVPKIVQGDSTVKDVGREGDATPEDLKRKLKDLMSRTPGAEGKLKQEAYTVSEPLSDDDKDKYQPRKGLEGPFRYKSGKVLYYDPKGQTDPKRAPGMHYDPSTDMYMEPEEVEMHRNPPERKPSKK
jgi:hypothetical protein